MKANFLQTLLIVGMITSQTGLAQPIGIFQSAQDIGDPAIAGKSLYDSESQE